MRRASHHANLNPVEARSGGWMRSLGSTESDPRQGVSVRQEAKNCVTWPVVGKGELRSNHSLLKRTRGGTVPDKPVIVGNPRGAAPDRRFRPTSSPTAPQVSVCEKTGQRGVFRGRRTHHEAHRLRSRLHRRRAPQVLGRRLQAPEPRRLPRHYLRDGDVLVILDLDRLGRRAGELITLIDELDQHDIGFRALNSPWHRQTARDMPIRRWTASLCWPPSSRVDHVQESGHGATRRRAGQSTMSCPRSAT